MRWFVIFLIVANLLLYLWVRYESLPPTSAEIPPPEVGQLRLMHEPGDDITGNAVPAPSEGSPPGDVVAPNLASQPVVQPHEETEPVADAAAAIPATAHLGQTPSPDEESELATSVSPAKELEIQPPEAAVASPQLGMEDDLDRDGEVATSVPSAKELEIQPPEVAVASPQPGRDDDLDEAVVASSPPPPPPPVRCALVGPLPPDDVEALLAVLPEYIELVSDTTEEVEKADGYYVLIPRLPDRGAGLRMLEALADAGFSDTWLFRKGPYRNAISLGLFSREGSARRHADDVADKGFDVEVRARTSTSEVRWLLLKSRGEGNLQGAFPLPAGSDLRDQTCPG